MSDTRTEARMFLALSVLSLVLAAIYWFTSYEEAGTTMLLLAGGLSLLAGGFLWRQRRDAPSGPGDDGRPYFPAASIWPFGIGVAAFFVANGLILGSWFLVPGGLVLLGTVVGFAAQSRQRS